MIEFHKVAGIPTKVDPGEERIWFTDSKLMFVADNTGDPTRIGAGFQEGPTVPVGTPPASGILYFCTGNGQYYLSNPEKWIVLNTEPKTGGGGAGAGYAGGVFLTDVGNYFTSNEVEGALQELASAVPHFMGTRTLQPLNSNLLGFKGSGERRIGANLSGSPTTLTSWLNQRQGADGKTYGLMVAENGDAFTRHGDNFTQLASQADLQEALESMGADVGDAVGGVSSYKVRPGFGINVSGTGTISGSPTVSLDVPELVQALDQHSSSPFLRTSGGKMDGDIYMDKATPSLYLRAEIAGQSTLDSIRFFNSSVSGYAGLRDDNNSRSFLNYQKFDGTVELNTGRNSQGVQVDGRLHIKRPNSQTDRGIVVENGNGHYIAAFGNDIGQISLLAQANANYIESDDNTEAHNARDLVISSRYVREMNNFTVLAKNAWFSGQISVDSGLYVGMDKDGYGKLNPYNKVYLFPTDYRSNQSATTARKYYSSISYNQDNQTVYINSAIKDLAKNTHTTVALNVSASKFITTSSEKYKEDIVSFSENAMDIVEGTDAWLYKLKGDESGRTNLGFILERGVPDIAIEDGGNSIDSYAMIGILWKAVQELNQKVKELS